jgi:hypothetical protein
VPHDQFAKSLQTSRDLTELREGLLIDLVEAMEPIMRKVVREEVPIAAAAIMTPDAAKQFWAAGIEVIKEQAQTRAGKWMFGRIADTLSNLFLLAVGAYIIYQVAGWVGVKLLLAAKGG